MKPGHAVGRWLCITDPGRRLLLDEVLKNEPSSISEAPLPPAWAPFQPRRC